MYEKKVLLQDCEHLLKVNSETGEVTALNEARRGNPGAVRYQNGLAFAKYFTEAWEWLFSKCTRTEYCIAQQMHHAAKRHNNSLAPLNDNTTMDELSERFNLNRNLISKALKKLYKLGVYGSFKCCNKRGDTETYWVLNPDLAFNGSTVELGIIDLFKGTALSNAVRSIANARKHN